MSNLIKRIDNLEKQILELKTNTDTVGDSATAYRKTYDLGDYPRDNYNHYFVWDFYFEPIANVENFTIMPIVSECWGYFENEPTTSFYRCSGGPDINDPTHIMVMMEYLPSSGYTVKGSNTLTVTANVDFVLKSSNKTSKTY